MTVTDGAPLLRFMIDGPVARLTLARPRKLNAISVALARDLRAVCEEIENHSELKVLVLDAEGRSFCSGFDVGDVNEYRDRSVSEQLLMHAAVRDTFRRFASLYPAKIAVVQGDCVGAGLLLACMCDIRVAVDDAKFRVPELDLGVPFSMGGLQGLVRLVGLAHATEIVLLRRVVTAGSAREWGLVNEVVGTQEKVGVVEGIVEQLRSLPGVLLSETIGVLREAGRQLIRDDVRDLTALVLSQSDDEVAAASKAYSARFVREVR